MYDQATVITEAVCVYIDIQYYIIYIGARVTTPSDITPQTLPLRHHPQTSHPGNHTPSTSKILRWWEYVIRIIILFPQPKSETNASFCTQVLNIL